MLFLLQLTSAEYFSENAVNIITLSGEIYSRKAMEKILNKEITTTLMNFASQFNKLNLSDLEIAILCAVRLTCSGRLLNFHIYSGVLKICCNQS